MLSDFPNSANGRGVAGRRRGFNQQNCGEHQENASDLKEKVVGEASYRLPLHSKCFDFATSSAVFCSVWVSLYKISAKILSLHYIVNRMSCVSHHALTLWSSNQAPTYHTSTSRTSNLDPSSLKGSLPNVGHVSLIPLSRVSSSHSP